jgi:hypothetical protein
MKSLTSIYIKNEEENNRATMNQELSVGKLTKN